MKFPRAVTQSDRTYATHTAPQTMPRTHRPRQSTRTASTQHAVAGGTEGKQYLRALIAEQELPDAEDVERDSDKDNDFDDKGSVLSSAELTDMSDNSISERSCDQDKRKEAIIASDRVAENEVSPAETSGEIATAGEGEGNDDAGLSAVPSALEVDTNASTVDIDGVEVEELPKVKGRFIGDHHFNQKSLYLSSNRTSLCSCPST